MDIAGLNVSYFLFPCRRWRDVLSMGAIFDAPSADPGYVPCLYCTISRQYSKTALNVIWKSGGPVQTPNPWNRKRVASRKFRRARLSRKLQSSKTNNPAALGTNTYPIYRRGPSALLCFASVMWKKGEHRVSSILHRELGRSTTDLCFFFFDVLNYLQGRGTCRRPFIIDPPKLKYPLLSLWCLFRGPASIIISMWCYLSWVSLSHFYWA